MKKVKFLIVLSILISVTSFAQNKKTKKTKVVYKKTQDGLLYSFLNHDKSVTKPKVGDKIMVSLNYTNSNDSVLFDSNDPKVNQGRKYIEFELAPSTFKGSFEDALMMMSIGDSASFQINADSVFIKTFFMKEVPSYIKKGSNLTFNVKLVEILTKSNLEGIRKMNDEITKLSNENADLREQINISEFVKANNIKESPTTSGLYFIPDPKSKKNKKNSTIKLEKGDTIVVNYTGRLLDGKIFDTNIESVAKADSIYNDQGQYKPLEIPYGVGNVIPGWEEGVGLMEVGTKATFIIPSSLAYAENGLGDVIPPFSTLKFEVELINIKPAKK